MKPSRFLAPLCCLFLFSFALLRAQEVTELMLIDATNDRDIGVLSNGDTLILDQYDTPFFNIRAEVGPGVESVVFGYQDDSSYRTENKAPFAFAGNSGSDYKDWTPAEGANRLTATAYSGKRGTGTAGPTVEIELNVLPTAPAEPDTLPSADPGRILIFHKTNGFRHSSIEDGIALINQLGLENGLWETDATDDSGVFTTEQLSKYRAVIWCNTSGNNLLTPDQQAAFEAYIRNGGGFVGIHAATDTYRDGSWPWYNDLVGAIVQTNPNHTSQNHTAVMDVVGEHPAVQHLDTIWEKTEEYYYWEQNGGYLNPDNIDLLRVRSTGEETYDAPRPISWYKEYDGGRAFYTALGHHGRDYREDTLFIRHIEAAVKWAAGFSDTTTDQQVLKRINCGGDEVVFDGVVFEADQYFGENSRPYQNNNVTEIADTDLDEIYFTERSTKADLEPMSYHIPVDSGTYTVVLHFAEIYFGAPGVSASGPGKRVFSVAFEGTPFLVDFDISAEVGALTAVTKTFTGEVTDGELTLDFSASANRPKISAIEILGPPQPGLPPALDCTWEDLAAAELERVEAQSAVIDDKLYLFSGFTAGLKATATTEIYDPSADSWTTGAPIPIPASHMGIAVVGQEIWIIGGFAGDHPGDAISDVQIYNPSTDSWRFGPPLPVPRASGAAAYYDGKIHHFGGLLPDRRTDVDEHYVFDLEAPDQGWTQAAPLPNGRNHLSAAVVEGKIYAIGGQYGHDAPPSPQDLDLLHVYDPQTDTWEARANLPTLRSHFEPGTMVFQNKIIIVGGRGSDGAPETVTMYDPALDTWTQLCQLPGNLLAPAAKVINDQLIVATGGLNGVGQPQNAARRLSLGPLAQDDPDDLTTTSFIRAGDPVSQTITAFPNPARDELTIRFQQGAEQVVLTFFDLNGRIVYRQRLSVPDRGPGAFHLHTGNWPQGMYLYRLQIGEQTHHDKVLISR